MIASLLTLLVGLAAADPAADLRHAADPDLTSAARMEAFERLVRTGTTDMRLVLEVCADGEADTRRRWVACRVLGQVRGDRARAQLLALLSDSEPAMRTVAVQALGDLGDSSVAPQVAELLRDEAIMVRGGAAEALGKLRNPDTVAPLAAALSSRDSYYRGTSTWVRRHYGVALGQIAHDSAIPTLLNALDDPDPEVVAASVPAFESIAGFSYSEGRSNAEQRSAWRRWGQARLQ